MDTLQNMRVFVRVVLPQLRPALLRLTRILRNQRVDMSVTLTQLSAMSTLYLRGPMSAGDLAAWEKVQPPSMTKVIAMLEAGRFPVERAVSAIVSMEEAPDMLAKWSDSPAAYTKIMVEVGR